jgi:hypothetical protein
MQCFRNNTASSQQLTALPTEVEARLLAQADQVDGLQFNGLSCGIGNGGGLCVTTTLQQDVQVLTCASIFCNTVSTSACTEMHLLLRVCVFGLVDTQEHRACNTELLCRWQRACSGATQPFTGVAPFLLPPTHLTCRPTVQGCQLHHVHSCPCILINVTFVTIDVALKVLVLVRQSSGISSTPWTSHAL